MFYLGIGLFVVFFSLWLLTLPSFEEVEEDEDEIAVPDDLSAEERYEKAKRDIQVLTDDVNYDRALITNNNVYCGFIEDSSLRDKCFERVVDYEELIPRNISEEGILDDANFVNAMIKREPSYCDLIINNDLKAECLDVFS